MQFSEIYGEIQAYYPKAEISVPDAKKYANRAYLALAESFQFFETEFTDEGTTTADGTEEYSVPAGAFDIVTMRDLTNKLDLIQETIQFYDGLDTSGDVKGQPEYFVLYGEGKFLLFPTPDGAYDLRIRYRKLPDEMVADGDEPVYPTQWHEVITLLGAHRAGMVAGFESKAINLKNDALGLIGELQERHTHAARRRIGQVTLQRTRRERYDHRTRHAEFL